MRWAHHMWKLIVQHNHSQQWNDARKTNNRKLSKLVSVVPENFVNIIIDLHLHRSSRKPFRNLFMLISLKKHVEVSLILKVRWLAVITADKLDLSHFNNFRMKINQNIYKYSEKKVMFIWQQHGSTKVSQYKLILLPFLNCLTKSE